jgi:hypothetical protein
MDAWSKLSILVHFCRILSFVSKMVYTCAMIYSKFNI